MHSLVEHLKKRKENTIKDGGDLRTSFSLPDLNEIITALSPPMPGRAINIILDCPPGPEGSFVEVELDNGEGIRIGEWIERGKYWALRITPEDLLPPAPMPDDVLRVINALIYDDSGVDAAIDMLERLQRKINYQAEVIEQRNAECSRQFKRIAELEKVVD